VSNEVRECATDIAVVAASYICIRRLIGRKENEELSSLGITLHIHKKCMLQVETLASFCNI
jgi:hypothetical protein